LQSPDPDQFTVYVLDQNEMGNANALNVEGSTILLSKSFSDALQGVPGAKYTPEEIEGVLGHEVGHGVLRHSDPDHPRCDKLDDLRAEECLNMIAQIHRENEKEADLFTVRDPKIAQGLVHRLMRDRIGQPPEVPQSLDTHPTDAERIAYLSQAIFETTKSMGDQNISCF
jgi:Zn-dependent protease with chaperone function